MPNRLGLTRYWFEFELPPYPALAPGESIRLDGDEWWKPIRRLTYGVGATGYDQDDCLRMIERHLLEGERLPPMRRVIPDVDIRTLDQDHVARNMGTCAWRGIWWPALWLFLTPLEPETD